MLEVGAEISGFESSVNLGQRARRLRRGSKYRGWWKPARPTAEMGKSRTHQDHES